MKMALLVPPSLRPEVAGIADGKKLKPPLGPLALASVLGDDHDVSIIDGQLRRHSVGSVAQTIGDLQPDLLGISLPFSSLWVPGTQIAGDVRDAMGPDLPIMWGGNVATFRYEDLLRNDDADIVVRYEA
ncbi:MAG: cobalamin-dependent protein, partial [Armatimonadota bacterium]